MPYITRFSLKTLASHPFPYDIPAVRFAKDIELGASVTCFVGDNGMGKSTLLEVLAFRLQLPHMGGSGYHGRGFAAARKLLPFLEIQTYAGSLEEDPATWSVAPLEANVLSTGKDPVEEAIHSHHFRLRLAPM